MPKTKAIAVLAAIAALLPIEGLRAAPPAQHAQSCEPGVYDGPTDRYVVVMERPDTAETGEWRYFLDDGRFGLTTDGVVTCRVGSVDVLSGGNAVETFPKLPLRKTPTTFESGELTLAGMLIEPPVAAGSKPPLVVAVHGSEKISALKFAQYPYILAAQGISAFVYDKRGTGASEGAYSQNFHDLAADAVAASREAKRLAKGRYGRFGLYGGSQGGWVAPRAANDAGADFVAVGFGLLIDPLEEDAEQVKSELIELGYGPDVLAKAKELTDATGNLMAEHFERGYERLAEVKHRHGNEPWFDKIEGEFTGDILAMNEPALRREGRAKLDNLGIDWRYDAMGWLRKVEAPQLWVVAGADREAPPETTIERLRTLRREGKPIDIVRFPGTDHGMAEFTQAPDGTRTITRVADGYFRLLGDWIKGRIDPPYGRAEILRKSAEPSDTGALISSQP